VVVQTKSYFVFINALFETIKIIIPIIPTNTIRRFKREVRSKLFIIFSGDSILNRSYNIYYVSFACYMIITQRRFVQLKCFYMPTSVYLQKNDNISVYLIYEMIGKYINRYSVIK